MLTLNWLTHFFSQAAKAIISGQEISNTNSATTDTTAATTDTTAATTDTTASTTIDTTARVDLEEGNILIQIYRPNLEFTTLIYKTNVMANFFTKTFLFWFGMLFHNRSKVFCLKLKISQIDGPNMLYLLRKLHKCFGSPTFP